MTKRPFRIKASTLRVSGGMLYEAVLHCEVLMKVAGSDRFPGNVLSNEPGEFGTGKSTLWSTILLRNGAEAVRKRR